MGIETLVYAYLNGELPNNLVIAITAVIVIFFAIVLEFVRRKRINRRKKELFLKSLNREDTQNQSGDSVKPDTSYVPSNFPLPQGDPIVNSFKRLRDGFMRWWFYDTLTVIRLKTEGKADHRCYIVKDIQMNTINWDNCSYHVVNSALIPIRKMFLMIVREGFDEPVNLSKWDNALSLVQIHINKGNYEQWTEEDKKKFGKFDFNPKRTYTKMNDRNAQLLSMTSIPNMQLMYYGVLVCAFCGVILLLGTFGLIDTANTGYFNDIKTGLIEIFKEVKK